MRKPKWFKKLPMFMSEEGLEKRINEGVDMFAAGEIKTDLYGNPVLQEGAGESFNNVDTSFIVMAQEADEVKEILFPNSDQYGRGKVADRNQPRFGNPGESQFWAGMGMYGEDLDRAQSTNELWDMQDAAFQMTEKNFHARAAVDNIVRYTIGKGIKWVIPNDEVHKWVKDFWNSNQLERRQKGFIQSGYIEGEKFWVYFRRNDGKMKLRTIPPKQVVVIETAPADPSVKLAYFRSVTINGAPKTFIYPDIGYFEQRDSGDLDSVRSIFDLEKGNEVQGSETETELTGRLQESIDQIVKEQLSTGKNKVCREGVPVLGPPDEFPIDRFVQFVKYGHEDEIRGRVPMAPALRLFRYKFDLITDAVRRHHEMAKVLMKKIILKGGKSRSSEATSRENRARRGGTTIVDTPTVKHEFMQPQIASADSEAISRLLVLAIGAALTMPEFILNVDACHDELTELLTDNGWISYSEITPETRAASVNKETGLLEFQQIQKLYCYEHDGDMVRIKGSHNLDMLVTPNHKMWVRKEQFRRINGKLITDGLKPFKLVEACELTDYSYITQSSVSGFRGTTPESFILPSVDQDINKVLKPDRQIPMKLWLEFLGYFVSEGWLLNNGSGRPYLGISQKDGEISDRMAKCFEAMPVNWNKHTRNDDTTISSWCATDRELWNWLKEHVRAGALNKKLPQFVHELDSSLLETLIQALVDGDGHRRKSGSMVYFTSSDQLADDILSIAFKAGYVTGIKTQMKNGVWPITMNLQKNVRIRSEKHITKESYNGPVWCVEVPNGLIVTRRIGITSINSNSNENYASIKKSDNPFNQMIISHQEFWGFAFEEMFRFVIQSGIEAGKLPKEVKIPTYKTTAMVEACQIIAKGLLDEQKMEDLIEEVQPILEAGIEMTTVPTGEVPINIIWPDMVVENPKEKAEEMKAWMELGVSIETIFSKLGLDFAEELARHAAQKDRQRQEDAEDELALDQRHGFEPGKRPPTDEEPPEEE